MATVDIRDKVTAALRALPEELSAQQMNPKIGTAEVVLFQMWMVQRGTNTRGWPSTGFWADAARSTSFTLLPDGVVVSIQKQGVRQQYQGGNIDPKDGKKYLTIPARAEAYGRRAGSFSNLVLAFHRVGGKVEAWGLVEAMATAFKFGKKRKDGSQSIHKAEMGGVVMYWLVKHVHQDADPTVLPPDDRIAEVAVNEINLAIARALRRN